HRRMPDADVVFEEENRLAARRQFVRARFFVGRRRRRGNLWQKNSHRGALAELALDANVAAALANNSVAGREPEPASVAFVLGRKKGLEQMLFDLVGHATAVVRHADPDIFS